MTNADGLLQLRPGYRLQFETARQEWILLFPEGMVQLNESAALVLQAFSQPCTTDDVVANLQASFPDTDIHADVVEFISDACEQRWLHAV